MSLQLKKSVACKGERCTAKRAPQFPLPHRVVRPPNTHEKSQIALYPSIIWCKLLPLLVSVLAYVAVQHASDLYLSMMTLPVVKLPVEGGEGISGGVPLTREETEPARLAHFRPGWVSPHNS